MNVSGLKIKIRLRVVIVSDDDGLIQFLLRKGDFPLILPSLGGSGINNLSKKWACKRILTTKDDGQFTVYWQYCRRK